MQETYPCPDGREVQLRFHEDALRVDAITADNVTIGRFQFALIGPDSEVMDLMDDTGEAVSFKLAKAELSDDWHAQGITERVITLVAEEISVSPVVALLKD